MAGASAYAVDASQVEKRIELKDGATVYLFKDGKMRMEDQFGRATYIESGHVMEAKVGIKIIINGNEDWHPRCNDT